MMFVKRLKYVFNIKKVCKWVALCCALHVKWVNVLSVINLNSMIYYYCIRKTILNGNGLSSYIIVIKVIYFTFSIIIVGRYNFFVKVALIII